MSVSHHVNHPIPNIPSLYFNLFFLSEVIIREKKREEERRRERKREEEKRREKKRRQVDEVLRAFFNDRGLKAWGCDDVYNLYIIVYFFHFLPLFSLYTLPSTIISASAHISIIIQ